MKLFATVSALTFILLVSSAFASLEYFGIENNLNGISTSSTLSIIFTEPVETFQFYMQEPITSLSTSENAFCSFQGVSNTAIKCFLILNETDLNVKMNLTSNAFATQNSGSYDFNQRFVINDQIGRVTNTIVLPVGMSLSESDSISPENAQKLTNGQNIMIFWESNDVQPSQTLNFKATYTPVFSPSAIPLWQLVIVGGVAAAIAGFFVYRRFKKPEEVVLSVLDEYEKKVMEVIQIAGGTVNQKRVVDHTNFSKAKVSRVVKSLVSRGVIETERRGRTNMLRLKKKFGTSKPEQPTQPQPPESIETSDTNETI